MAGARTQSELAKALGVSQPAVSKLIRGGKWPVNRKRGPWSNREVAAIQEWHHGLIESRDPSSNITSEAGQLQKLKLQTEILLKQEQRKLNTLKRQILEAERVTREQYEGALGGLAEMFVDELEALRLTLVQRYKGIEPASLDLIIGAVLGRVASTTEVKVVEVSEAVAKARSRRRGRNTKAA